MKVGHYRGLQRDQPAQIYLFSSFSLDFCFALLKRVPRNFLAGVRSIDKVKLI